MKKTAPPPIKKRTVAIVSDDESGGDEGGEDGDVSAEAAEPVQVRLLPSTLQGSDRCSDDESAFFRSQGLSIAVKVDPSLPNPMTSSALPNPPTNGASVSSFSKPSKESDLSEEDVPLAQRKVSPPPVKEEEDVPLPPIKRKSSSSSSVPKVETNGAKKNGREVGEGAPKQELEDNTDREEEEEAEEEEEPKKRKKAAKKSKDEEKPKKKKTKAAKFVPLSTLLLSPFLSFDS